MSAPANTVLLTGFGAYAGTDHNPAEAVVRMLDGSCFGGANVVGTVVENNFDGSFDHVRGMLERHRPGLALMLGEYAGRAVVTVERFAVNRDDSARYGLADNSGEVRRGSPSVLRGPLALESGLPVRAMVSAMRQAGVPADESTTAGTFVCNHLFYRVLHHVDIESLPVRVGWIHLPRLPEAAAPQSDLGLPSMSAQTAAAGVGAAIEACLSAGADLCDPPRSRWQI